MKNTKMCPKCSSTDLVVVEGWCGSYGTGNNIMVGSTIFSAVPIDRYICCHCGFSEEWIRKEDLEDVKKSRKSHKLP